MDILNMIAYRKVLIGHLISYEILRYPTISNVFPEIYLEDRSTRK